VALQPRARRHTRGHYGRVDRRYNPPRADVAQLVEHQLPKLRVAGSNPVVRSSVRRAHARLRRGAGGGPLRAHSAAASPPPRRATPRTLGFVAISNTRPPDPSGHHRAAGVPVNGRTQPVRKRSRREEPSSPQHGASVAAKNAHTCASLTPCAANRRYRHADAKPSLEGVSPRNLKGTTAQGRARSRLSTRARKRGGGVVAAAASSPLGLQVSLLRPAGRRGLRESGRESPFRTVDLLDGQRPRLGRGPLRRAFRSETRFVGADSG
jgi:hypothetical protein